jgi:truncated hemoglobin YjbI
MAAVSETEKTLYARLGGYDVIAAVVDEFLQTISSDPQMVRFSAGMNLERRKRNRSSPWTISLRQPAVRLFTSART